MNQLTRITFNNTTHSHVRHLAERIKSPIRFSDYHKTLCGLSTRNHKYDRIDNSRFDLDHTRLCMTCKHIRFLHDADRILPEPNLDATARGAALRGNGAAVREIGASVWRVEGSTDTYTVTVPEDEKLASVCTCMAGKVHPEKECKHQVMVHGVIDEERLTA